MVITIIIIAVVVVIILAIIGIYNNHDKYFIPANFMDGNFAKGYAVYGDAEMDDAITHEYDEPVWDWADDYSSATATFTCTVCGH